MSQQQQIPAGLPAAARLFTVSEGAEHLRVSQRQVWRLVELGQLRPAGWVGRSFRFRLADLDAALTEERSP